MGLPCSVESWIPNWMVAFFLQVVVYVNTVRFSLVQILHELRAND